MKRAILYYHCLTPLHNGAGTGIGLIDRPIIRERTTKLPFLQATSIKGVLRALTTSNGNSETANLLFGDDDAGGSKYQGCIDIEDASLLAMPVRSLKGGFVWATCDLLLMRLNRTIKELGYKDYDQLELLIEIAAKLTRDQILVPAAGKESITVSMENADSFVFLEEYGYSPRAAEDTLTEFAEKLAQAAIADSTYRQEFARRLCVLRRDDFLYFAEHATDVQANIKIELDTGTTQDGSLRYTEYLPQESILMGRMTARKPTITADLKTADDIYLFCEQHMLNRSHRFGADQTIGKGITWLRGEVN